MSLKRAPLWKQLIALWLTAVALAAGLVWVQLHRPYQFYWLIPYPFWRLLWPDWAVLFRDVPFFGAALVVLLLALAATPALCVRGAASLVRRARTRDDRARGCLTNR